MRKSDVAALFRAPHIENKFATERLFPAYARHENMGSVSMKRRTVGTKRCIQKNIKTKRMIEEKNP